MGDVAMCAPVLESLVIQNPDCHFTVVTSPRYDTFFSHIDNVTCITVDTKNGYKGVGGLLRLSRDIARKVKFSAVIDIHSVLRSRILSFFIMLRCGVKIYTIDKNRAAKKAVISGRISVNSPLTSTVELYATTFRRAGLILNLNNKIEQLSRSLLLLPESFPLREKEGEWIGFAPFAQHEGKRCPIELCESLINSLSEKDDRTLFLFGGSSEEKTLCEKWERPGVISVVRKLSLAEELVLISNLDVMISMDSGAQHMSSIVGTRVISVWGATHPYLGFLAYGQSLDDCVGKDLDCRPCSVYGGKPCRKHSYECLKSLKVSDILTKLSN